MKNHTHDASGKGLNRAKPYQLVLFPLNNGATNVYFVLILSYVAQFGSSILHLGIFASLSPPGRPTNPHRPRTRL